MENKQNYEVIEAIHAIENLDAMDTYEVVQEIVSAFGIDQVVDWLNWIESAECDGYKITIVDNTGLVIR